MANFTASLLSDGERIIIERRQHWLVLVDHAKLAILGLVVALLIFIFRGNLGNDGIGGGINFILGWVVLALVVYAVVVFVYQYLHWVNDAFIVTSRRVIQIEGILNKKALDSSLEKINDAVLTENVFGRMLRLRRPRDPDRVRVGHRPDAHAGRRRGLQAGDDRSEA